MFKGKVRKVTIALLVAYTILMLYFLFFGFDRMSHISNQEYWYNLIPNGIPLYFPIDRDFQSWYFNFANFAAFLPYGIFIPLLFPCRFSRFIILFCVSISIIEILQMITHLGSFDIDDVLINTLGSTIGFCAQKLVPRSKDTIKGMSKVVIITTLLSIGTTLIVDGMNNFFKIH